ncbi:MAG TPA: DUF1549 and DUF1553 domain-containing protein [Pirellulales bacterium]|nr:DUF1549 and DUF1553 domain-containing protein [Pirellulales bacterium]
MTGFPPAARADEPYGRFQFDPSDRDHWSFLPVKPQPLPSVHEGSWPRNPIDSFILARLEAAGLRPAPAAQRRTLLRRVYFDLIGLPPTPDEQRAFLADDAPDALARQVDALLDRPEYGERWGRHWLDLVRYAESNGYERDGAKPSVWRYRDYVIDAFTRDKPYDQFVREQIAGDELDGSTAEMQIATTFLRLGPWDDEPADAEVDRYDQLDDLVGATTATFLAQTVRCARCHDHKFEVFTQRDYSRLLAVFEPLKRPRDGRTDLDRLVGTSAELASFEAAVKQSEEKVAALRNEMDAAESTACRRLIEIGLISSAEQPNGAAEPPLPAEAIVALAALPEQRTEEQRNVAKKFRAKLRQVVATALPDEIVRLEGFERQIQDAQAAPPPEPPRAYIWYEDGPQAPATHVLKRGNPRDPAEEVDPGVPAVLVDAPLGPPTQTDRGTGRRRQLAEWLTRGDNPLVARVMVNRIWQHHFGDGLVGSENDFGIMGEAPTHPELLDWLAGEFVAHGWSVKHMHRLMVLSNTYQQSSSADPLAEQTDPRNDLLGRFAARRLEAEAIRDAVLAASGRLNPQRRGPSVYPVISPAVLASQSRPGNGWGASAPADAARRSIYVFVKRTLLVPELEVLDLPDTNGTCEQRQVSTVAPQALTYLNGEFIHEQAVNFAKRLIAETADAAARIDLAYAIALSRPPSDAERAAVGEFLARQEEQINRDNAEIGQVAAGQVATGQVATAKGADDEAQQALTAFCLVLLNTNEFVYLP